MRSPHVDGYSLPFSNRLHYVLVKVSSRTYCVAEYNGKVAIPPTEIMPALGKYQNEWQHGPEFEIVSESMSLSKATDRLMYLAQKRLTERPIILRN